MRTLIISSGLLCAIAAPARGAIDLSTYTLSARVPLTAVAAEEASAVTYDATRGTLFVVGDEGDAILEYTTAGLLVGQMNLAGFDDTESVTSLGNGQLVMAEERLQDAYRLTYAAGTTVARASLPTVDLGPTVGNVGVEGMSYDPADGSFVLVKEKTPQRFARAGIDFAAGTATVADLFAPETLGTLDLSDVQTLSAVAGLDAAEARNLILLSQESNVLLEVTRDGAIQSQLNIAALTDDAEGVTIAPDGTIYLVAQTPELFVLRPIVPEPTTAAAIVALATAGLRRRR